MQIVTRLTRVTTLGDNLLWILWGKVLDSLGEGFGFFWGRFWILWGKVWDSLGEGLKYTSSQLRLLQHAWDCGSIQNIFMDMTMTL